MDRFLDELSKRYEQLMYKKLDKIKEGEINGNVRSKWARKC